MPGVPHRRKAPGTRADERPQRQRGGLVLAGDGDGRPLEKPPADADKRVHALWDSMMADPVARAILGGCASVALARYWALQGEWWGLYDEIEQIGKRAQGLAWSTAQRHRAERRRLRSELSKLTEDLRKLETDWGLSPVGRLRLGVLYQQARGPLAAEDVDGGDEGEEVPDPPPL